MNKLGSMPIGRLLLNMALPACSGILVIMLYNVIDTMFVGHYAGPMAIAGLSVVLPVSMLLPTLGMAIGIGSSSIISRSLGAKDFETARRAFCNALSSAAVIGGSLTLLAAIYAEEVLYIFGGRGEILPYALEYYRIILVGIPVLGCWMCMNNTLRAEGHTKQSFKGMCLSSGINVVLDALFIAVFEMGLKGAAYATVISQVIGLIYSLSFYLRGKSHLHFALQYFRWDKKILNETFALGASTFARQGAGSVMVILLNQSLYLYGGPVSVAVYGVLHRIMSLLFVPVIGMTQGFLPIVGYNFGAREFDRVREAIFKSITFGTIICSVMAFGVWLFPEPLILLFTDDPTILATGSEALKVITLAMPVIASQNIGAAYYQAINKPVAALILTLSRQVLILIPMLYVLPKFYGMQGVWLSFPVSDILATGITVAAFIRELPRLKKMALNMKKETPQPAKS